jgi:hypothetical protein
MSVRVRFFPLFVDELSEKGIDPQHKQYVCGACGEKTTGRIVAETCRGADQVLWCLCSCPRMEPAILIEKGDEMISQMPAPKEFHAGPGWPPDLAQLFSEAAQCYASGAYTATAMVCRKILMVCACAEGAEDGKPFASYVDKIIEVLSFERARNAIDAIRHIGNDANHALQFVGRDGARRALSIVAYMLNTMYSLPSA